MPHVTFEKGILFPTFISLGLHLLPSQGMQDDNSALIGSMIWNITSLPDGTTPYNEDVFLAFQSQVVILL